MAGSLRGVQLLHKVKRRRSHELVLARGPEGLCVYLNQRRIAGPDPGREIEYLRTWAVRQRAMEAALQREDADGFKEGA
jgi:hypothetical protein